MMEAMLQEILLRKEYLQEKQIQTLYFGGGTPSLLSFDELTLLIQQIKSYFSFANELEFTLEANPDDISEKTLQDWKSLGVNRLSIGVQSFLQTDLDWMNRAHSAEESLRAIQLAKIAGFQMSVDLIYGLPSRSVADWKENIDRLTSLSPEHISAYCLTIEKGTALQKMIQKGELIPSTEEEQALQFEALVQELKTKGYEQYEISNFAKNQHYSKHNSNYWRNVPYLGIGPSAHSFDGTSRQWNVANNQRYIKNVLGGQPYFEMENLAPTDRFNELLLTGLRTKWGVSLKDLQSICAIPKEFSQQLTAFINNNMIVKEGDILRSTEKGKLQADFIASTLFLV